MADSVKRYRESAARLMLAVSVIYIVISLVRLGYLLVKGSTFPQAARDIGGSSLSIVMVLACVGVGLWVVLAKPVRRQGLGLARGLAVAIGIAALLQLVFLVAGLVGGAGGIFLGALEVLGGLLEIAIKLGAAQVLLRAVRAAWPTDEAEAPAEVAPAGAEAQSEEPEAEPVVEQQASWSPDQAAGAVWTRAGDAATGAAASGWGHPGEGSTGWQALPGGSEGAPEDAPQALPKGPWATAADLAEGGAAPAADAEATVSWGPVRRNPQ